VSIPDVPELNGLHILIVDDNDDAREILQSYLALLGANVTTAQSGGEALGMLQEVAAHVIISDLSMPGMTGHEFLQHVRKMPSQVERPTPAIALTAFDDPENRRQAVLSGFDVYLVKPVDPLQIVHQIHRILAAREEPPKKS
jgi:CheY-like chemotaxis protein